MYNNMDSVNDKLEWKKDKVDVFYHIHSFKI